MSEPTTDEPETLSHEWHARRAENLAISEETCSRPIPSIAHDRMVENAQEYRDLAAKLRQGARDAEEVERLRGICDAAATILRAAGMMVKRREGSKMRVCFFEQSELELEADAAVLDALVPWSKEAIDGE